MDDGDRIPTFEPLTPRVTPDAADPTPTSRVGLPAASFQASDPANRAGESTTAAATSSRSATGPGLAGVLATSVLAAVIAAGGTAGLVLTATAPAATPETAAGASPPASGTPSSATPLTISASDAVVAVAEQASPAVVTITTDSVGRGRGFGPFSMPSEGVGSGFVFGADGLILTNLHVIEGGEARASGSISVTFQDGSELPATVISTDETHDLAVIKVDATGLPTIELGDSSALKVGQLTVAIGSPLGTFTETVTSGILSATGRTIEVGSRSSRSSATMTDLLQTDAAINEGNSGGPLLDSTGRVIGVNVAVAASAQGIGFAVPIDLAADVIAKARAEVGAA